METDKIKVKGKMTLIATYPDGHQEKVSESNAIVNTGFDFVIKSMIKSGSDRPNPMSHIAVGSSSTATTTSMTALVSEVKRGAATWSYTANSKKFTGTCAFAKGAITSAINEGGVFNASSGGVMLDRCVLTNTIQGSSDLQYTAVFEFELI